MKTLGFLNPKARAGQSRLVFNLGWVLADAGFRVGLVDFDPQAGLTELAGASSKAEGSLYGVLAPRLELADEIQTPELVELAPNLGIVRGHIQASIFDDILAGSQSADPRALALIGGIGRMLEKIAEQGELQVILCDLGSSLGPFSHAVCAAIDAIVVPVAPTTVEGDALRSLASALRRWRETPGHRGLAPSDTLGFVFVRPSGVAEVSLEQVAAAYHRELHGTHIGTIKEFPSLAAMARRANKPEIELSMADGAMGSLAAAVVDLRRQYEVLATEIVRASGLLDEDVLVDRLGQVLYSELEDDLPAELDALSSSTAVRAVDDIELGAVAVRRGGLRIVGSASVSVTLQWGGSRDGLDMPMSFPLRFDLELDRSHESVMLVHRLEVDTSSFRE